MGKGVGESGLVGDVVIRIGRFTIQTPLGAPPGLGNAVIGIGFVKLFP